jgi:hypothetical protein
MKNKGLASSIIEKQFWIIIILIFGLVISNGVWIWYVNQYDFTTETVEQSVEGIDNSTINQTGIN